MRKTRMLWLLLIALAGCSADPAPPMAQTPDPNADAKERVRRVLEQEAAGKTVPIPGTPKAKYVSHQVKPFVTANGQDAQIVLIKWKSVGTAPVDTVYADIIAFGSDGSELGSSARDYGFWSREAGVKPGETVSETGEEGFILLPFYGQASHVEVRITRCK